MCRNGGQIKSKVFAFIQKKLLKIIVFIFIQQHKPMMREKNLTPEKVYFLFHGILILFSLSDFPLLKLR